MIRFVIFILIYLVIFCITNSLQKTEQALSFVVVNKHINISHAFKDTILSYENLFYSIKNQYKANDSWTNFTINGIQELHIYHKNISKISENIFQRIKNLRIVSLKNNHLDDIGTITNTKFHECAYNGPALESLQIQYNMFNSINLNALIMFYPNLNNIDLSHNQITTIMQSNDGSQLIDDKSVCNGQSIASSNRSISLNLAFNKIKYLPLYLYNLSTTQHIKSLDLSHNQIHYLPTNFLKHYSNLEYLNMQHNNVKVISLPKILTRLSNLRILLMAHNPSTLSWLDNYTLQHKMLQTLDLSNTSASQIGTSIERKEMVLPNLPNLKYLNISHNIIPLGMHLTSFSFSQLTNLTHLDMSHTSNVYQLPHHSFKHNPNLVRVSFEGIEGIRCNCRYLVWFGIWLREKLENGSKVILPVNLLRHEYPNDMLDMNDSQLNSSIVQKFPGRSSLYQEIARCKDDLLPINDCFDREPGNTVAGQKLFNCRRQVKDDLPPPPLLPSHLSAYKVSRVKRHARVLIKIDIGQDIVLSGRDHLGDVDLDKDLISLSWYYKYRNKWLSLFQKVSTTNVSTSNQTFNDTGREPFLKVIQGSKNFLHDGTILIKSAQRIDAGLYSLLMIKRHKITSSTHSSNNGMIILEDLPMVLYFGTDYFIEIWKSTILFGVGGAFTFLFFAIVVTYLIKCFKMCQCIHRRAKTQKFSKLIQLLQQQTYDEVENLRNHYIGQLNKLKEACCVNMEAITGYQTTPPKHQRSSSGGGGHYVSQMKDCCGTYIRDYGCQVGGSVREAYASQLSRMREYAALQVERMTESYAAQVDKLNAFTYTQMDRVRERYKIEAKHIGDVIEMMNINNCRTSIDPSDYHEEARFYVDGEGRLSEEPGTSSFYQEVIPFDRSRIKRRLDELSGGSKGGDPFFSQSEAAIRAIWERGKVKAQELWEGEPIPHLQQEPLPLLPSTHYPSSSCRDVTQALSTSTPLNLNPCEASTYSCCPVPTKGDLKGPLPNGHIPCGQAGRPQNRLLMTKSRYASLKLKRRYSGRSSAHTSPRLVKRWSGPISTGPAQTEKAAQDYISTSPTLSGSSSLTTTTSDDCLAARTITTVTAIIDNPQAAEAIC